MSLQRGSFGIEFDDRPGPSQRLWWLALLVPLAAVGLLAMRGCRGAAAASPLAQDSDALSHQESFEPKTARERPSLLTHFLQSWRAAPKEAKDPAAAAEPEPKEGWQASVPPKLLSSVEKRSPEVKRLLQRVAEREAGDDWVGERQALRELMVRDDADDIRAFVERKIADINIALIFSDRAMPEKTKHRIASGDFIAKITKKYGTTQEYVLKVNGIEKPEQLRIGREVWVLNSPVFELTVFKKKGSAVLTLNGRFFKRYAIGVGHPEDSPSGVYKVRNRARRQADGAADAGAAGEGSQGTCWVGLAATGDTPEVSGFGLHGTWNESTLGRQVDAGRIRFANADIEELYVLLPVGALVNVAE